MRIVSNTSTVLNLAIIGHLDLLRQQMDLVWVPPAVISELRVDTEMPGAAVVRQALQDGWLQVQPVKDLMLVTVLQRELDHGESEAIALALQMQADWLLLDERDGRRVAKSLSIKVTGVLGVLLRARREHQISSLAEAIMQLRLQAGFRIAPELESEILRQVEDG
jgi:uncharacterized protein